MNPGRAQAMTTAFLLLAACTVMLFLHPGFFIPFGTLYEAGAFYGSGNLYLSPDAAILWTLVIAAASILIGQVWPRGASAPVSWLLRVPTRSFLLFTCSWILVIAQLISWQVFEHHPRDVDHVARVFQARTFASGQLAVEAPPLPEFFSVFAVLVVDGEMFSKYAPGGALFLAIPELLAGTSSFIHPVLGTLAALLIYLASRNWFDERTARLALVLTATSPWFLFMIASLHSHVPALFLFTLIWYLFTRLHAQETGRSPLILAGLAGGVFVATREYTSVLVCLPLVLHVLAGAPRLALRRLGWLAAGFLPPALGLLTYNYRLTGDPLLFPHLLADPEQVPWFGYKGHTPWQGLVHLWEALRLISVNLHGWPLSLVFVPFCLVPALARGSLARPLVLLACFLTVAAGYFANYWSDYSLGARYYFETFAVLVLLSAAGFWRLHDFAEHRDSVVLNPVSLSAFILLGMTFCALVYLPRLVPVYGNEYNGNVDTHVAEFARSLPEQDALVFCEAIGGENGGYASGFLNNPIELAAVIRGEADSTAVHVFARDRGDENRRLMALMPGRQAYHYRYYPDSGRGVFTPLDNEAGVSGHPIEMTFPTTGR